MKDSIKASVKLLSSPEFLQRVKEEDERMVAHLDILRKINQKGFLTVNSQAGIRSTGRSQIDGPDFGKPYETNERAYLLGFMLEAEAAEFLKKMSLSTDKNAIFVPFCDDSIYIPRELDIPLTVSKVGANKEKIVTHMSIALPESVWNSYRKQARINKSEKVVFLLCWDTKWNRNASSSHGLFTDVLKMLS